MATETWVLTEHCCRVCFGRVLKNTASEAAGRLYRCSNCGAQGVGRTETVICACGLRHKNGKDMGLRCVLHLDPSPEFPSEVVVEQVAL